MKSKLEFLAGPLAVVVIIGVVILLAHWLARSSAESTSTSTSTTSNKPNEPQHSGNVFIYVHASSAEPPMEEDISVFNHKISFQPSEISNFVKTNDGVKLELGSGEEVIESFADYKSSSGGYFTIAWNGKEAVPLVRYPTGADGKRHKAVLNDINIQIYNPKFPEYERFQKLEPYQTFTRKTATGEP